MKKTLKNFWTDESGATSARVLTASRALVGVAARSLGGLEADITLPQYRALVLLHEHRQLNAGSLAEHLGVKPSTMTGLCDRLARKGLIERGTSPSSRREVTLRLSRRGRALISAVIGISNPITFATRSGSSP